MQRKEVTLNDKELRDETCTLCIDVQYLLRFTYAVIPTCKLFCSQAKYMCMRCPVSA